MNYGTAIPRIGKTTGAFNSVTTRAPQAPPPPAMPAQAQAPLAKPTPNPLARLTPTAPTRKRGM